MTTARDEASSPSLEGAPPEVAEPRRSITRGVALRLWPYPIGLAICLIIGLAERQSRQAQLFGEGMPMADWLALRLGGPWHLAITSPADGWPAYLLLALLPLHLIWPRWWLAPVVMGTLIAWCFWGSQIIGRMA